MHGYANATGRRLFIERDIRRNRLRERDGALYIKV